MVSITNQTLLNLSVLGVKNSSANLQDAFKSTLEQLDPNSGAQSDSPTGNSDILSDQINEFLHGDGGVSGYVESHNQDTEYFYPINSPLLISSPADNAVAPQAPDTSFLEDTTRLKLAQARYQNSINTAAKGQEKIGSLVDLLDNDK